MKGSKDERSQTIFIQRHRSTIRLLSNTIMSIAQGIYLKYRDGFQTRLSWQLSPILHYVSDSQGIDCGL